jgi:hypothetical protein
MINPSISKATVGEAWFPALKRRAIFARPCGTVRRRFVRLKPLWLPNKNQRQLYR